MIFFIEPQISLFFSQSYYFLATILLFPISKGTQVCVSFRPVSSNQAKEKNKTNTHNLLFGVLKLMVDSNIVFLFAVVTFKCLDGIYVLVIVLCMKKI